MTLFNIRISNPGKMVEVEKLVYDSMCGKYDGENKNAKVWVNI